MAGRFFTGFPWRFIFTDIPIPGSGGSVGGQTTTWADSVTRNRQIVYTLDQASVITCDVDSSSNQVNLISFDGFTEVSQTKRLIYAFRREATDPLHPWVCRAAGIVMVPEDQADTDVPLTHLTAYDPWKYLEGRPVMDEDGNLPGPYGFQYLGLRGDQIVTEILKATIESTFGGFCFVDAGVANGGTAFYSGTIEETLQINFDVQQGTSVADAWTQVCESGFLDIVLTPIYDPVNRPGYTHELNVYNLAGSDQPTAVMGWDQMNRSLSSIDRLHDATPGNFADVVQYYVGQGGPPAPLEMNDAAIAAFGYYWSTQFFPDQTIPSAQIVTALAQQALTLSKQGQRTTTVNLTPERSPIVFLDYNLGDRVPIYASNQLRTSSAGYQRVQAIPIIITDDGIEEVQGLLCSPDWRQIIDVMEIPRVTARPTSGRYAIARPRSPLEGRRA
jgi:hypothetical protein